MTCIAVAAVKGLVTSMSDAMLVMRHTWCASKDQTLSTGLGTVYIACSRLLLS